MEKITLARPYAEAIFRLAQESGRLDDWSKALGFLAQAVQEPQLAKAIENPAWTDDQLLSLLKDLGAETFDDQAINLIRLLLENQRLELVPEITQLYEERKAAAQGSLEILISSPYAVNKTQEKRLAEALAAKLGKKVIISTQKDPSLIGGVKIQAGDLVIDDSLKNRLSRLATELGI